MKVEGKTADWQLYQIRQISTSIRERLPDVQINIVDLVLRVGGIKGYEVFQIEWMTALRTFLLSLCGTHFTTRNKLSPEQMKTYKAWLHPHRGHLGSHFVWGGRIDEPSQAADVLKKFASDVLPLVRGRSEHGRPSLMAAHHQLLGCPEFLKRRST